jgi:hypothetical protein
MLGKRSPGPCVLARHSIDRPLAHDGHRDPAALAARPPSSPTLCGVPQLAVRDAQGSGVLTGIYVLQLIDQVEAVLGFRLRGETSA